MDGVWRSHPRSFQFEKVCILLFNPLDALMVLKKMIQNIQNSENIVPRF